MNRATALACAVLLSAHATAAEVCDRQPKPVYPVDGVTVSVPFLLKYRVAEHDDAVIVSLTRKLSWTQRQTHNLLATEETVSLACAGRICGLVVTDLPPGLWTWTTRIYDPVARCQGPRSASAYFYVR